MPAAPVGQRAMLPLLNTRHPSAVDREWSGRWVAVGFAEQLPADGDLLPATIGWHGAHVRRLADGGLVASLNARPFGGCFAIPAHCASTQNISCAHLGCAFSKDPDVLTAVTDPEAKGRRQFVGNRPDRAVDIPVRPLGSLLFVNVTTDHEVAWDPQQVAGGLHAEVGSRTAGQVSAVAADVPWTEAASWVARHVSNGSGDVPDGVRLDTMWPNVTIVQTADEMIAFVARPAGSTRSTVYVAPLVDEGRGQNIVFGELGRELVREMAGAA